MTAARQNGYELIALIKNGGRLNTYDLKPEYDRAKSFYGKAEVITNGKTTILKSYDTFVAAWEDNTFKRLWGGYSATTMRHVNEFIKQLGIDGGGAAWWRSLPVEDIEA